MIVYGIRKFGRCDDLEGDIHVATKFFHIWFIPLVPTETFLVLGEESDGFRGIKLPMSGKSVFAAYFRTTLVALAITGVVLFPFGLILTALAVLGFVFSYKLFSAGEARKAQLLSMVTTPAAAQRSLPSPPAYPQAAPSYPQAAPSYPQAAPVREGPPVGPNLALVPNFDFNALRALIERSGGQPVAAPPNASMRWWTGTTAITLWVQQGNPTILVFEGPDAEPWKQTVANLFGYVALADVNRMLQSHDPTEARFGIAVAALYRDGRLRPSVDRLRMHPDAWVRADAERAVQQLV